MMKMMALMPLMPVFQLCMRTFAAATDAGVKMASRASASQLVTSYCTMLYKEQVRT